MTTQRFPHASLHSLHAYVSSASPDGSAETGLRWGGVKLHPYHSHRGEPTRVHVRCRISPTSPSPRGCFHGAPASDEPGVERGGKKKKKKREKLTLRDNVFLFPRLSFPRERRGGGGGGGGAQREGERWYTTLPQTPPLSDWKVMGLKETFSHHSPHLSDFFFFLSRRAAQSRT